MQHLKTLPRLPTTHTDTKSKLNWNSFSMGCKHYTSHYVLKQYRTQNHVSSCGHKVYLSFQKFLLVKFKLMRHVVFWKLFIQLGISWVFFVWVVWSFLLYFDDDLIDWRDLEEWKVVGLNAGNCFIQKLT